ncbi:hypothetical protein AN958_12156 [Leucoagaricus sp. SymC.cos]|nr:hypothetical protein AN958_12156 [Leucoagaricus sp. SymC.cos]
MTNTRLRNLDTFKKICGSDAYRSVGLVTTHWDEVRKDEGARKEGELLREYWKELIHQGASTRRFDNTYASAWRIIHSLSLEERVLQLQGEMAIKKLPLSRTKAGQTLNDWLDRAAQTLRKFMKRLRMMKQKAASGTSDGDVKDGIQVEFEEAEQNAGSKLKVIEEQQSILRAK